MSGLVNYGSSDEDEEVEALLPLANTEKPQPQSSIANGITPGSALSGEIPITQQQQQQQAEVDLEAPLVGPAFGPSAEELPVELLLPEVDEMAAPQSPYSANRALLRDLTLPSIANYDIPPSPPGSPVQSTNAKFKHFLDLKRQGIHFNEKLAKSSALKNPSVTQKLMDFADIDEAGQFATTLPKALWNPAGFPESAYKEELGKSQQKILKKKEDEKARGQRESVEFVPAIAAGETLSRGGTPGVGPRSGQKSAAERIMAGLDGGARSSSPHVHGTKRKTRFES